MKTSENISALTELASSQWGMFTTAQAASKGISRVQLGRMSSDGRIEPMAGEHTVSPRPETQSMRS